MIVLTGDIHGPHGIRRLSSDEFPLGSHLTKQDYVIILGDFGLIWDNSPEERYWLDWLDKKPWTTLFIDGNHENHPMLNNLYNKEFGGDVGGYVRDSVTHLRRGHVYEIDGKRFFTMGGAQSHDIDTLLDPTDPDYQRKLHVARNSRIPYRIVGKSWWPEELPSEIEMYTALARLQRTGYQVDYILSHCASTRTQNAIPSRYTYQSDRLTDFLDQLEDQIGFTTWFFGHYHCSQILDRQHICLYEDIMGLDHERRFGPNILTVKSLGTLPTEPLPGFPG